MSYPLGYPVASSGPTLTASDGGVSRSTSATKDSRSRSSRVSPRKLAGIAARLSPRDVEIVAAVAKLRVVSGGQLQRLFWPEGSPQTRARLARHGLGRLARFDVLAPLTRRVGGVRAGSSGRCYALGLVGQRLPGTGRAVRQAKRPHTPGERHLAHTLAVSELYVKLVEAQRWGTCEVLCFEAEPACWRPFLGQWGSRMVLKSDAFLKLGVGDYAYSWLIEIDMATESLATIDRKSRRHLDYYQSGEALRRTGVTPRVAWLVPDEARLQAIAETIDRLGPDARRLFAVVTATDALALLPTGVWT